MPRLRVKRIDTVGFVDKGDDPAAEVVFWKRAAVEKSDGAETYAEQGAEEKINGELWDKTSNLRSALRDALFDAGPDQDPAALIETSLNQFVADVRASAPSWLQGKPMQKAPMKTEGGAQYPASAYAYVPDPQKPSTWKLRLWESPSTKVTSKQVGMALAALSPGGFRGNRVQIPAAAMSGVKSKIRAAWRSVHASTDEMPAVLKKSEGDDIGIVGRVLRALGLRDDDVDKLLADGAEAGSDNDDGTVHNNGDGDMANDDVAKLKADLEAAEQRAKDAEAALATGADGDVAKRIETLEKRAEEAEKRLQDEVDRRERETFIGKARSYAALPGVNPDDFGPILRKIHGALDETEREKFDAVLKAADEAIKTGKLYEEVGHGSRGGGTVSAEVDKLAQDLMDKDASLTKQVARGMVWKKRPDLATAYEAERRAAVGNSHEED